MFEIGFAQIAVLAIFLLIAFPVHEFAHAWTAYQLGDATAKMFGRLTLNPIKHFDPFGGLMLIVSVIFGGILFGWAKPTPVNPSNLRDRRNGEFVVAVAGPVSNLLMALIGAFVFRLLVALEVDVPFEPVGLVLFYFVAFNVALAIFNLIPVPPLDGSHVLEYFLPTQARETYERIAPYGFIIVFAFIWLVGDAFFRLLRPVFALLGRIMGIPSVFL